MQANTKDWKQSDVVLLRIGAVMDERTHDQTDNVPAFIDRFVYAAPDLVFSGWRHGCRCCRRG